MAQVPPPFNPQSHYQPARRQSGPNALIILLVVLVGFCAICGLGVFGMGTAMKKAFSGAIGETVQCSMEGSLAKQAIKAYVKRTGKFPAAETWQADTKSDYAAIIDSPEFREYRKMPMIGDMFKPSAPGEPLSCGSGTDRTGFAYNDEVAGHNKADYGTTDKTTLLYETNVIKYNNHGKYDPQEKFKGPAIEGQPRDRITFVVGKSKSDGQFEISKSGSSDDSSDDDKTPPDAKTDSPDSDGKDDAPAKGSAKI